MDNQITKLCAFALVCLLPSDSLAVTVQTSFVKAEVMLDNSTQSEQLVFRSDQPITSPSRVEVYATEEYPSMYSPPDIAELSAVQDADGFSTVSATVTHDGIDPLAANGDSDYRFLIATAERGISFENHTNQAVNVTFDYTISGIELAVVNAGGGPQGPAAIARFYARAFDTRDNSTLDQVDAIADLEGDYNDFSFSRQDVFTGAIERQECFSNSTTCLKGFVAMDTLSGSLNLGVLKPGDWFGVTTLLATGIIFNGTELGASAKATDPNGVQFSWTITPVNGPAPVPVPATALMLLTAIGTLTMRRKR